MSRANALDIASRQCGCDRSVSDCGGLSQIHSVDLLAAVSVSLPRAYRTIGKMYGPIFTAHSRLSLDNEAWLSKSREPAETRTKRAPLSGVANQTIEKDSTCSQIEQ